MGMKLTIPLSICQLALLMWWIYAVYIQEDVVRPILSKRVMLLSETYLLGITLNDDWESFHGGSNWRTHLCPSPSWSNHSSTWRKMVLLFFGTNPPFDKPSQSDLLLRILSGYADIIAVNTLPEARFGNKHNMKSIRKVQRQSEMPRDLRFIHLAICRIQVILKDFT